MHSKKIKKSLLKLFVFSEFMCALYILVSYTHLTLPTKRIVSTSVVADQIKKKKKINTE